MIHLKQFFLNEKLPVVHNEGLMHAK